MNIDFWPKNPKANFQNAKMNLTSAHITSYQLLVTIYHYENKPNSNPIKPNFGLSFSPQACPELTERFMLGVLFLLIGLSRLCIIFCSQTDRFGE